MKYTMLVFLAACTAMTIDSRPIVAQDGSDELPMACASCDPRWSATVGSVFLSRSKARPGTLVLDGTTGAELSNVADFDPGWASGPQVELSRHFDPGWDVGVRYFSIDGWRAAHRLADTGNLRVPLVSDDPADFFDTASASYTSRLYSTEVNLKRQWGDRLRLLAGFRWVELHEKVSAEAYSPALEGMFDIGSSNYLYGFQMGAESVLYDYGPLRFDGYLKAGVYGNHIRGSLYGEGTHFHMDDPATATASRTSFLGELGLTARYQFNSHWAAYCGYQLMWIDGVALAGDYASLMADPSATFSPLNGAAFYHGAQVGVAFTW